MKLLIILILTILNSFVFSKHSTNGNLFAVTSNLNAGQDPQLIVYSTIENKVIYNTQLQTLHQVLIKGIQYVNRVGSTVQLFCTDKANTYSFLYEVNCNSGRVVKDYGAISNQYRKINNNVINPNYLYHGDQVYLPAIVDSVQGLVLLVWNFDDTPSAISTFALHTLTETSVNPIGGIDGVNKILYIAYQAKGSKYTSIASIPLVTYGGSSSNNNDDDEDMIERTSSTIDPVINGLITSEISLLYCDDNGNLYAVLSLSTSVNVCKIDIENGLCITTYSYELPLNPNGFSFNPIFINQDKTDIITLLSKQSNFESLLLSIENVNSQNWSFQNSTIIENHWNTTGTFDYTYFAY